MIEKKKQNKYFDKDANLESTLEGKVIPFFFSPVIKFS